jgi:hypothetical protein
METEVQEKNGPTTLCCDCVFATWDGQTQIGCKLDRLEKLRENGAEIIEAYDENEKEFYVIEGRICNTCRNMDWGKKHPKRKWRKIVEDEIRIRCDIVIYVSKEKEIPEVTKTIDSALQQQPMPVSIILALEYGLDPIPFVEILMNKVKFSWYVEEMKNNENPIDAAIRNCKGTYHLLFHAGYIIPEDYLLKINKSINNDMKRFIAIQADENDNGSFMQNALYKALAGNKHADIFEKVRQLANDQNNNHMIKTQDEI